MHDTLEQLGLDVLIADAQTVRGWRRWPCKNDRIDARVLAVLSQRDLVPAIWRAHAESPAPAGGR